MSRDVFVTTLRNSLKEIRNICPDVTCSFPFTRHSAVVAGDEQADDPVMEKAVHIAMVTSKDADMPYLRSVTRVIIPTILKLPESVVPTPSNLSLTADSLPLVSELDLTDPTRRMNDTRLMVIGSPLTTHTILSFSPIEVFSLTS